MKKRILLFLVELYGSYDVLSRLVSQQLILRYRRTSLGYLWTLINPLLMMSVMAVVFSTLFKADLKTFAIFLFAGMVPWNFFSSVVSQSGSAFLNNEGLIKKIYLPKTVFPLSIIIALLIDSVLSLVALFVIIIALGGPVSWALIFIPFAYLMLFFLAFGTGLVVSIASVFFRDLQYIMAIVMQALFFLTPILYKSESLGGKVAWLVALNPLTPFIELFRAPLYLAALPSTSTIIQAGMISISVFIIGVFVFIRNEKQIVFRL